MKKKIIAILSFVILASFALGIFYYSGFKPSPNPEFGLTFSPLYAQYLGFGWKTVYLDMLNDLKPKRLRLMAYWEMIEPEVNKFDFQIMDEMLIEAQKRNIDVILVLGGKQPRWPECHHPGWVDALQSDWAKQSSQLEMIKRAVSHFKNFRNIKIWQVENEPLFAFGPSCPKIDPNLVKQEVALVRSLDQRPVMLTDSGEKGNWVATARLGADVFGSTMYRVVEDSRFGYYKYPLPPLFFRIKAGWLLRNTNVKDIIGVELQAEPWFTSQVFQTDLQTQDALMNPKVFAQNVNYAKKVGFSQNYLWGVEWWFWLAKKQNDWGMWQAAKNLFSGK